MITKDVIRDKVYELYKQAVIVLGDDVKKSLEDALEKEEHDLARLNIEAILKNIELAEEKDGFVDNMTTVSTARFLNNSF